MKIAPLSPVALKATGVFSNPNEFNANAARERLKLLANDEEKRSKRVLESTDTTGFWINAEGKIINFPPDVKEHYEEAEKHFGGFGYAALYKALDSGWIRARTFGDRLIVTIGVDSLFDKTIKTFMKYLKDNYFENIEFAVHRNVHPIKYFETVGDTKGINTIYKVLKENKFKPPVVDYDEIDRMLKELEASNEEQYGYWFTDEGKRLDVDEMQHNTVASRVISKEHYKEFLAWAYNNDIADYKQFALQELGWIRVTVTGSTLGIEVYPKAVSNNACKAFTRFVNKEAVVDEYLLDVVDTSSRFLPAERKQALFADLQKQVKKNTLEAALELVDQSGAPLKYVIDPTPERFIAFVNKTEHKSARGLINYDQKTIWWDAGKAIHSRIAKQLMLTGYLDNRLEANIENGKAYVDYEVWAALRDKPFSKLAFSQNVLFKNGSVYTSVPEYTGKNVEASNDFGIVSAWWITDKGKVLEVEKEHDLTALPYFPEIKETYKAITTALKAGWIRMRSYGAMDENFAIEFEYKSLSARTISAFRRFMLDFDGLYNTLTTSIYMPNGGEDYKRYEPYNKGELAKVIDVLLKNKGTNVEAMDLTAKEIKERITNTTVLYHGTARKFDKFSISGERNPTTPEDEVNAIFFTTDPVVAYTHGRRMQMRLGGKIHIIKATIDFKNMYDATTAIKKARKSFETYGKAKRAVYAGVDRNKYDGIAFRGDAVNNPEYVVFNPDIINIIKEDTKIEAALNEPYGYWITEKGELLKVETDLIGHIGVLSKYNKKIDLGLSKDDWDTIDDADYWPILSKGWIRIVFERYSDMGIEIAEKSVTREAYKKLVILLKSIKDKELNLDINKSKGRGEIDYETTTNKAKILSGVEKNVVTSNSIKTEITLAANNDIVDYSSEETLETWRSDKGSKFLLTRIGTDYFIKEYSANNVLLDQQSWDFEETARQHLLGIVRLAQDSGVFFKRESEMTAVDLTVLQRWEASDKKYAVELQQSETGAYAVSIFIKGDISKSWHKIGTSHLGKKTEEEALSRAKEDMAVYQNSNKVTFKKVSGATEEKKEIKKTVDKNIKTRTDTKEALPITEEIKQDAAQILKERKSALRKAFALVEKGRPIPEALKTVVERDRAYVKTEISKKYQRRGIKDIKAERIEPPPSEHDRRMVGSYVVGLNKKGVPVRGMLLTQRKDKVKRHYGWIAILNEDNKPTRIEVTNVTRTLTKPPKSLVDAYEYMAFKLKSTMSRS